MGARPQRRAGVLKNPRMRTLLASSPLGVRRCAKGGAVELGGSYLTAKHRLQTNSRSIRRMSERVRTRFAPSPTGFLHVGTARTALYSYLSARRAGGQFLLRIEDTDTERNVADSAAGIVDGLRWLGLDWDEGYLKGGPHGPYVQSERLDRYHAAVNALVAHGDAYLCYCTNEELDQRRRAAQAHGLPPGYDGHCRHLRPDQVRAYEAEGRRPARRWSTTWSGAGSSSTTPPSPTSSSCGPTASRPTTSRRSSTTSTWA